LPPQQAGLASGTDSPLLSQQEGNFAEWLCLTGFMALQQGGLSGVFIHPGKRVGFDDITHDF
jgi:hypothetical protein